LRLPEISPWVASALALAGHTEQSREILKNLQDAAQKRYVPPTYFATIYLTLGNTEQGLDWLEKTVDEHDQWVFWIHADNYYNPLRSHPRYQALLRKMNLEP
jgi:hypothetical protein